MISFTLTLEILELEGEKKGWVAAIIPKDLSQKLNPGVQTSYRLKGTLDDLSITQKAILPIGEGDYILPFNSGMRKSLNKTAGDPVHFKVGLDTSEFQYSEDFLACLEMDERALEFYETIANSHKKYYSNWIESAKTIETKTKRINQSLFGLAHQMDYGTMVRHFKKKK